MVELKQLKKTYNKGRVKAVQAISFNVKKGELFGLIGPDGAGKSSIFRMLTTLLLPDSGSATVHDFDVVSDYKQIRKIVGYMPGKFSLYQDLSVTENLHFFATIFNTSTEENYDLIKDIYVQLEPFKNRKAGDLSGGMKQKLALCCALIHKPEVLFLDEPTTGVDVVSRRQFWEMLKRLQHKGITILVSTPYMDEAKLCDRVALIQKGEILSIDTPENITNQFPEPLFAIKSDKMGQLLNDLRTSEWIKSCQTFGAFHHIVFNGKGPVMQRKLLTDLRKKAHKNTELKEIKPTIEDCFIELM